MKYIYIVLALSFGFSMQISAQQESLISQYRSQMSLFNPAAVSLNGASKLSLIHRRQSINIPFSPITTSLAYGFDAGKNVGLGVSIITDKIYVVQSTFISVDYSYRLQLDDETFFYMGIKAGGNFHALNTSNLNTYNAVVDPSMNSVSFFIPNIGLGAYYQRGNFNLSVGVPRILDTKRSKAENGRVSAVTDRPHLYTSVGYDFLVYKANNIRLQPSIFSRIVGGAPITTDFNTMVSFNNRFDIGATYRTNNTYAGIAQMDVTKELTMGWVYEVYNGSELSNPGSSLEFLLMYQF